MEGVDQAASLTITVSSSFVKIDRSAGKTHFPPSRCSAACPPWPRVSGSPVGRKRSFGSAHNSTTTSYALAGFRPSI